MAARGKGLVVSWLYLGWRVDGFPSYGRGRQGVVVICQKTPSRQPYSEDRQPQSLPSHRLVPESATRFNKKIEYGSPACPQHPPPELSGNPHPVLVIVHPESVDNGFPKTRIRGVYFTPVPARVCIGSEYSGANGLRTKPLGGNFHKSSPYVVYFLFLETNKKALPGSLHPTGSRFARPKRLAHPWVWCQAYGWFGREIFPQGVEDVAIIFRGELQLQGDPLDSNASSSL
ncbi:hypothetical protein QBC35DRAFT_497569 [Podospora australis]|uniref:Uncharacterized protein n=1 Tax=Podospora australis TaxID=1536484 RepID=A0AAN6WTR6_9PEZI|nr:hypothetical protein QBC35DRAFT_497569 [Podospora australis]